jgi:hypothetical protein
MPTAGGPNILGESNLVFAIDTHDTSNGITPLGCGGFNGSTQGVKNLLTGTTYSFENGMKLAGRNYFTAAGISYPEWNYGGDIAGYNGIYAGYNVRGGTGVYGASRSLHLWVWNNQTNSWIEGYFNGARLSGHCYDNYGGAENGWENEMTKFINDYNTIKNTFPDCTYIVLGSHACQCFRQIDVNTLIDLGAPSSVSSWTNNGDWREFILVGKPGLGAGNAFGWVFENYPTNSAAVAHLNFGLPIKARGGIEFDGTNDYVNLGASSNWAFGGNGTIELILKPSNSTGNDRLWCVNNNGTSLDAYLDGTSYNIYMHGGTVGTTTPVIQNAWNHVAVTYSGGTIQMYINGVPGTMAGTTTGYNITNSGTMYLGCYTDLGYNLYGEISIFKTYNRALTAQEVKQNYQQYKTRFNLS